MKKFFWFLFASMMCIVVMGCSKDCDKCDNNEDEKASVSYYKSLIVGTWNLYKDWENGYGYSYWSEGEGGFCFQPNGDGYWFGTDGTDFFSWDCDADGNLTVSYDVGQTWKSKIKKIDQSELVLSYDRGDCLEYYNRAK